MRKQIKKLLNSDISTSAIAKGAGVPWSTVADLRKGKNSIDKMALLTAEKLNDFAEELEAEKDVEFYN
ncbi:Phage protein [Streptococcus gordonii]|uniref:Phage protein n=1 Tax=Streptococcus gordonii TaxID=1302 RepID=A0A139NCS5_STRGN|nr:Phage protein [Streptococcus gordonii]